MLLAPALTRGSVRAVDQQKLQTSDGATIRQVDPDGFTAALVNRATAKLTLEDYRKSVSIRRSLRG